MIVKGLETHKDGSFSCPLGRLMTTLQCRCRFLPLFDIIRFPNQQWWLVKFWVVEFLLCQSFNILEDSSVEVWHAGHRFAFSSGNLGPFCYEVKATLTISNAVTNPHAYTYSTALELGDLTK